MFKSTELNFLNKLLNRIKYTEFDSNEINDFANSPIANEILEKLKIYFEEKAAGTHLAQNVRKIRFEFDNEIGIAIRKRLEHLDENALKTISELDDTEAEKFALDLIGPIDYEEIELIKLKKYITELE